MKIKYCVLILIAFVSCKQKSEKNTNVVKTEEVSFKKGTFGYDKVFLQENYKNTLVLESDDKKAMVVLSPELQGRVMTSSLNADKGESFGWLNYDLIASKETN